MGWTRMSGGAKLPETGEALVDQSAVIKCVECGLVGRLDRSETTESQTFEANTKKPDLPARVYP